MPEYTEYTIALKPKCLAKVAVPADSRNQLGADLKGVGLQRTNSTAEFAPLGDDKEVEYFFASDASAIIEHTDRVIYLLVSLQNSPP